MDERQVYELPPSLLNSEQPTLVELPVY